MFTRNLGAIFVVVLLLGLCAGCAKPTPVTPDKVTVQFSWFHTAEFAGFYAAQELGYYAEENLEVDLIAGGPVVDPISAVLAGDAQFGTVAGDNIIRSQLAGQDVVAVASIFRQSPLIVMSLPESGIRKPQDLVGKTVGVISPNLDTTWDIQFLAMLDRLGIDPESMTFVPNQDYHGANELTSGRVDAASSFFSTNEPVLAEMEGIKVDQIFYSEYGVVIYANPIFTSGQLIRENPGLVERFMRATLKGYRYAVEHPDDVGAFCVKYDENLNAVEQAATMVSQIPLIDTGDVPVGWMDESVWRTTQDVLLEQKVISAPVDLTRVYTNQFVEKAR